jgi:fibronectin type 3 domain-containing protein
MAEVPPPVNLIAASYENYVQVRWEDDSTSVSTSVSSIFRLDAGDTTLVISTNSYSDNTVVNLSTYTYNLYRLFVEEQNDSSFFISSLAATVSTIFILPPPAISFTNLRSTVAVQITPTPGISTYLLYRNETFISTLRSTYTIDGPFTSQGFPSLYRVEATDGIFSSFSLTTFPNIYIEPPTVQITVSSTRSLVQWHPVFAVNMDYIIYKDNVETTYIPYTNNVYEPLNGVPPAGYAVVAQIGTVVNNNQYVIFKSATSDSVSTLNIAAPAGIQCTNIVDGVSVQWNSVPYTTDYTVYRGGLPIFSSIEMTTYIDSSVNSGFQYTYSVQASNAPFSVVSRNTATVTITYLNPPSVLTASNVADGISVIWNDVPGADAYIIYRSSLNTTSYFFMAPSTSFIDTSVDQNVQYAYWAQSIDTLLSSFSVEMSTSTAITRFRQPFLSNALSTILVQWEPISSTDVYEIYRDGQPISSIRAPSLSYHDNQYVSGQQAYSVLSYDILSSAIVSSATASIFRLERPAAPIAANGSNFIRVEPNNSADATGYHFFRDSEFVASKIDSTAFYIESNVDRHGSIYTYSIAATNGNSISAVSPITSTLFIQQAVVTNSTLYVSVSVSTFTNYGISSFEIIRDNTVFSTITFPERSIYDDTVVNGQLYSYKYRAIGSLSTLSADRIIRYVAVPYNFTSASNATGKSVSLVWTSEPCDAFRVFRATGSDPFMQIATTTETSFEDQDVVNGQDYTYAVQAVLAGELSAISVTTTIRFFLSPKYILNSYGVAIYPYPLSGYDALLLLRDGELIYATSQNDFLIDNTVRNGETHVYTVCAIQGPLTYKIGSIGVTYIDIPHYFRAEGISQTTVNFVWDAVEGADSYTIYGGKDETIVETTMETRITLPLTRSWSYFIRANKGAIQSGRSNTIWSHSPPPGYQMYPRPLWTRTFHSSAFQSSPSIITGPDGRIYFAVASRGSIQDENLSTIASPSGQLYAAQTVNLFAMDRDGGIEFVYRDPLMYATAGSSDPCIVFGTSGELYMSFTVGGTVSGRYNMNDVVNLCDPCHTTCQSCDRGQNEVVLARIDGVLDGEPRIVWRVQDANINSCSNETLSQISYDPYGQQVLMAYQSEGTVLCSNNAVGSPNIIVCSFTPLGQRRWTYQGTALNGPGLNRAPSITADANGGVYIAYTVTEGPVGGNRSGPVDVEVVKIVQRKVHERLPPTPVREWVLSGRSIINAPNASNTNPSISLSQTEPAVLLGFCTTGLVPGGSSKCSPTGNADIVFVSIALNGNIRWIQQNNQYNRFNYNVDSMQLRVDSRGTTYAIARGAEHVSSITGTYDILPRTTIYALNPKTGIPLWEYLSIRSQNGIPTTPTVLNYYILTDTYYSESAAINVGENYSSISAPSIAADKGDLMYAATVINASSLYIASVIPFDQIIQDTYGIIESPVVSSFAGDYSADIDQIAEKLRWTAIDSSADGRIVYLTAAQSTASTFGFLYSSADSGNTWTARTAAGNRNWIDVLCSATGSTVLGAVGGQADGYTFTSYDAGSSWQSGNTSVDWVRLAGSDTLATVVGVTSSLIYRSSDAGMTWTTTDIPRPWKDCACSSDGSRMYAVADGHAIQKSVDAGLTWSSVASTDEWRAIDCSAQGNIVVAAAENSYLAVSMDYGSNWFSRATNFGQRRWNRAACSADGRRMAAYSIDIPNTVEMYTSDDFGTTWMLKSTFAVFSNGMDIRTDLSIADQQIYGIASADAAGVPTPSSIILFGTAIAEVRPRLNTIHTNNTGSHIIAGGPATYIHSIDANGKGEWYAHPSPPLDITGFALSWIGYRGYAIQRCGTELLRATVASTEPLRWNWSTTQISSATTSYNQVAIACNYDAMKAVMIGSISTSTSYAPCVLVTSDYGATWNNIHSTMSATTPWSAVACDALGNQIIAATAGGYIYYTSMQGTSWSELYSAGTRHWTGIATGLGCSTILACGIDTPILRSVDAGTSWSTVTTSSDWKAIDCTTNGEIALAAEKDGMLWLSRNSGVSWSTIASAGRDDWASVHMSEDGLFMVACTQGGRIWQSAAILQR